MSEWIAKPIKDGRKHLGDEYMGDLIRCMDCKYSEPWYADKRRCFLWSENGIDVFEDGFCNYAKRKEE